MYYIASFTFYVDSKFGVFAFKKSQFLQIALRKLILQIKTLILQIFQVLLFQLKAKMDIIYIKTKTSLLYSSFDVKYIYSPNRYLRTEIIHKKISRKLLQHLKVRHIIFFFNFAFICQSQLISVNAFYLTYINFSLFPRLIISW